MGWLGRRRGGGEADLTVFFATDVHGSELCFKKLVAAREFYGADVVILGGDLTGKMLVPIVATDGGWEATYVSGKVRLDGDGVTRFEKMVRDSGYYPVRVTGGEPAGDERFREAVIERLEQWDELAGGRFPIYVAPGNDDELYVDEVLSASRSFVNAEGTAIDLPAGYRLLSTGWANRTPWKTAREMDEEDLLEHLRTVVAGEADYTRAVFNLHVPPIESGLDTCLEVNDDLEVVTELGQPKMFAGGSSAVRQVVSELQPLVSLHGHIHESRGAARLGRTLALNPGSEYSEGVLRGVLVKLSPERVDYQFTSG